MNTALDAALSYIGAGFSVLPIRADGSKAPAAGSAVIAAAKAAVPADHTVRGWYAAGKAGVGILGGAVSGGLTVMDFEFADYYERWALSLDERLERALETLPVVRTPGKDAAGGRHVYLRCRERIPSMKLARMSRDEAVRRTGDAGKNTAIETKGEGGYVLAPGCPPECNEYGRTYEILGSVTIEATPTIDAQDALALMRAASALGESVGATPRQAGGPQNKVSRQDAADKPGSDYNARGRWEDLLPRHGWRLLASRGGVQYWTRPGKEDGVSATVGYTRDHHGNPTLYVFSSNAAPLEEGPTYTLFGAYAVLEHGGNFSAATAALGRLNYGEAPRKKDAGQQQPAGQTPQASAAAAPAAEPPAPPAPADGDRPLGPVTYRASEVVRRRVQYLWDRRIPLGKLTVVAGMPAAGKTFLLCDVAARVSSGGEWPDLPGVPNQPADVLFISAEDEPDDTLVPRMADCGADLDRIRFLHVRELTKYRICELGTLELAAAECDNLRLVVIDPPTSYMDGQASQQNTAIRGALTPLKFWAQRHGCSVVMITHLNKKSGQNIEAINRITGDIAWSALARAAHLVAVDPSDRSKRVFAVVKSNNGPEPPPLRYQIVPTEGDQDSARVEWLGVAEVTADEAVGAGMGRASGSRQQRPPGPDAAAWLVERMRERQSWPSQELKRLARLANVSGDLFDARATIKAISWRKTKDGSDYEWYVLDTRLLPAEQTDGDESPF